MKRIFAILILVLMVLSGCKTNQSALPPDTFPSGLKYADLEQTIDNYVASNEDKIAALSIAVFTKDNILLEKAYGYTNIEDGIVNDANAVYDWGSISKTLVWVSAMQLVEQGKLDLNADIRAYLPDGFFSKLEYDDPITMLHLMNHTTGWAVVDNKWLFFSLDTEVPELGDFLQKSEPAQLSRPGERYEYSNYGAAVAGYVVECIAGMPFYEYVHTNIFDPAGMTQTALKPGLSDNEWVKKQRAELICYYGDDYGSLLMPLPVSQFQIPLYPTGQATSTLSDLRKYAQALFPDEKGFSCLFTKKKALKEMYTTTSTLEGEEQLHHGFFSWNTFGSNIVGHEGVTASCKAAMFIDIDNGVGVAIMINDLHGKAIDEIPALIFEEK